MAKPASRYLPVGDLSLDLRNYRTVPQGAEEDALHALVSIDPGPFWGLTSSLISDGYEPTENIIVLREGGKMVVKEGNRRVAAMKLILGIIELRDGEMPSAVSQAIAALPLDWKTNNASLPCLVFGEGERDAVDRIIGRIHGKDEASRRLRWPAVAKARHNRDENKASEPGLDILEKFLISGRTISADLAEAWSGDYPVTVLDDFIKTNAGRFGARSARELADTYPASVKHRSKLDQVIADIGHGLLKYKDIRIPSDELTAKLGLPPIPSPPPTAVGHGKSAGTPASGPESGSPAAAAGPGVGAPASGVPGSRKIAAIATTDPASVKRAIRHFKPKGPNREKVVDLLTEARTLNLAKHPHAFCFVLRSVLEISAAIYCDDRKGASGAPTIEKGGKPKTLEELINGVYAHLTNNGAEKGVVKRLHSAMTTLRSPTNFLSVTSLNQLIHGTKFTVDERAICTQFHNIFPLIQAMNE